MAGSDRRSVTMADVARRAGVSRATVSYVLNNWPNAQLRDETRARVLKAAAELGYRPNQLARSLKTRRTNTLGVLVVNVLDPFFARPLRGIEDIAEAAGYNLFLCNTDRRLEREKMYVELLLQKHVDGVIVISSSRSDPIEHLLPLQALAGPVVLINRYITPEQIESVPGGHLPFHRIHIDHEAGARAAVAHLVGQGHRRIAFLGGRLRGPAALESSRAALRGYRGAMEAAGIPADPEWVLEDVEGGNLTGAGARMAGRLLRLPPAMRPTAAYAVNDYLAIGAMWTLQEAGVAIPHEFAIVGNDEYEAGLFTSPALSTVRFPFREIGREAARIILQTPPPEPIERAFPGQLIVRASSRVAADDRHEEIAQYLETL